MKEFYFREAYLFSKKIYAKLSVYESFIIFVVTSSFFPEGEECVSKQKDYYVLF